VLEEGPPRATDTLEIDPAAIGPRRGMGADPPEPTSSLLMRTNEGFDLGAVAVIGELAITGV